MKTNILRCKHLCACCHTRPALFNTAANPQFRARKDHDLCRQCFRRYKNKLRRWIRENTLDGWLL
jgi:hypothetical protein